MKSQPLTDTQQYYKNARLSGEYAQIWKNTGKCVFCDLKKKYILFEENEIALTINLFPYTDGQLMAIPRQHVSSPKQLSPIQWETIRQFGYIAKKMIKKVHHCTGMWTLIREGGESAQMSVAQHLHIQFIPFNDPQLCTWQYQPLKYTPLENIELYKHESEYLSQLVKRYKHKYQPKK